MKFKKLVYGLKKTEKIILAFLALVIVFTGYQLGRAFYLENTEVTHIKGGTYTEGAVGQVNTLNPLFVQQGTVEQDISQLIFSGLSKYDTETGEIVDDLAAIKAAENGKKYTFIIKENAFWHDGTPVTADDVIFTYEKVIKSPEFNGNVLNYNDYTGVKVAKVDNRTVEFLLEKPDAFFLVKTMVGILPEHLLRDEPISFLSNSPFNFNPIGSGPYKFVSQVNLPDASEYGLEAFTDYYDSEANITNIVFKLFSDYETLLKNLGSVDGVRNIPAQYKDTILKRDKFALELYQLPQYVAIFINNEGSITSSNEVRLGLQLGTDKKAIVEALDQNKIIDTPLLEIDQENWVHQHSVKKANGALFEAGWEIPNKEAIVISETDNESVDEYPTKEVTFITSPNQGKDWATDQNEFTIRGNAPEGTESIIVNDYVLSKYQPGNETWSYIAAERFDNLTKGVNVYEVYAQAVSGKKELIDSITIEFDGKEEIINSELNKLKEENESATVLPIRENSDGQLLTLNMITSERPAIYGELAEIIKEQWLKIGVNLNVEVLENEMFQSRLANREYDLLLFGQNLGYNLDAYPYWHSSQAKEDGLNLSQFKNFVADSLFEKARLDDNEARLKTLNDIQEIIAQEVPAVFLYSPTYYTALTQNISHPDFRHLATISDRLSSIETWRSSVNRKLKEGVNPLTFIGWIFKQF